MRLRVWPVVKDAECLHAGGSSPYHHSFGFCPFSPCSTLLMVFLRVSR
jgi:hypothetical protein